MQFTIFVASFIAALAVAAPTQPPKNDCSNGGTVLCCAQDPTKIALLNLKLLTCSLNSILGNCNNQVCCINTGSGNQTCSTTSGINISIPISIGPLLG